MLGQSTTTNLYIQGLPFTSSLLINPTLEPLTINQSTIVRGVWSIPVVLSSGTVSGTLAAGANYILSSNGVSSSVTTSSSVEASAMSGTALAWTCPTAGTIGNLQLTAALTLVSGLSINNSISLGWKLLQASNPGSIPIPSPVGFSTLGSVGSACTSWNLVASSAAIAAGVQYAASCTDAINTASCQQGDRIVLQTNATFGTTNGSSTLSINLGLSGTLDFFW
jgi:hypothetical protein